MSYCQHCGSAHAEDATFCPRCGSWVGATGGLTAARAASRYAGFWSRVGAQVIDQLVIGIPFNLVTSLFVTYTQPQVTTTTDAAGKQSIHFTGDWGTFALVLLASWLITLVYTTALISSPRQATVGKMALGLVVTNEHGERVTPARALARYVANLLNVLTVGIGYLMVIWTPRKQALHDRVAGTVVVPRAG